jgi:hypothetical protein
MKPEERVLRFCDAMADWERRALVALKTADSPESRKGAYDRLVAIFDEHLSEKGKKPSSFGQRLGGGPRLGGGSASEPPQYAQVLERVEGGRGGLVYVVTRSGPGGMPNTRWRYAVRVDAAGECRIDDARACVVGADGAEKWNLRLV